MVLGISVDEAHRMKPSRLPYITHQYPLVDAGISRSRCLAWMREHGFPRPPRSACVFCPYHSDAEWERLRREEPVEFAKACDFESRFQAAAQQQEALRGVPFLHRSLLPLASIDFTAGMERQADPFGNECEGMCGV